MLDPQSLRSLFDYDPETGKLYWKTPPHPRFKVGQEAGSNGGAHRKVMIAGKWQQMHRVIWVIVTGDEVPDAMVVDHKNCDGLDNRWENLRLATLSQNGGNARPQNKPLPKGVSTHRRRGKVVGYRAFISRGAGKSRYLGLFPSPDEAHAAYQIAAAEKYGEFARFAA